jgi:inner membrane protein
MTLLRALVKPALVALLALILFIPVGWIRGLVHERQMRSAYAVAGISDPQGIRAVSSLAANDTHFAFHAGPGDSNVPGGLHVPLPDLRGAQTLEFAFTLELAGSEALALSPLGADTTVSMRSGWPHPSFAGRFLPLKHDIGAQGFTSEWKISRYAAPGTTPGHELSVGFVEPAGLYQRLERASKYGFLFIGLTFAAFMLCELLRRLAIHPIQYALVGLALASLYAMLYALLQAEDRPRVFARLEARIGAELVGGVPEPLFQRVIGFVFFGWCDPAHGNPPLSAKIA